MYRFSVTYTRHTAGYNHYIAGRTGKEKMPDVKAKFNRNEPAERYVTRQGVTFKELNPYALACGYIQVVKSGEDPLAPGNFSRSVTLWREHDHWHVRYVDFNRPENKQDSSTVCTSEFYRVWEVFETLAEARKCFNNMLKEFDTWYLVQVTYSSPKPVYDHPTLFGTAAEAAEALSNFIASGGFPITSTFRIVPVSDSYRRIPGYRPTLSV